MSYEVEFRPGALDNLEKLDHDIGQRVLNKIKWLAQNLEVLSPQPLTGILTGLFKLRVGDYRVIYSVNKESKVISVHLIGHRRDIYR